MREEGRSELVGLTNRECRRDIKSLVGGDVSELNKYEETMVTDGGQGGNHGQRDEGERKNMRIDGKINDATTPGRKQSA